jgi:hypothetical protein
MCIIQFPADVWGTVSDWVMIIVTTITAYFLYKTLKSQKEVQQAQNKFLEIEQVRLREDYKPELDYNRFEKQLNINQPGKQAVSFSIRNKSENRALNVTTIYSDDEKFPAITQAPNPRTLLKNEIDMSLHYLADISNGALEYEITFTIEYEDVAGTKYQQTVLCEGLGGGESIKKSTPTIINTLF